MNRCSHSNLMLIPPDKGRLRCRHCHLTIKGEELTDGYCPECFEKDGVKRDDFETVAAEENPPARYRCENCGAIITAEPPANDRAP